MKRLSVSARVIIILYLVIAFFMLVVPPTGPAPLKATKGYVPGTDYGALLTNILALSAAAGLALVVSSLVSGRHKDEKTKGRHKAGVDNP
jgi:hypothetical protein